MNTRQVIHGISMGAATTMAVSGEDSRLREVLCGGLRLYQRVG